MEIRAYDEAYVVTAQNILGHAVDFAVMTLNIDPDIFADAFLFRHIPSIRRWQSALCRRYERL